MNQPEEHTWSHDDLPPCLIYVDKEGRLWHQGAEMIHEGINQLLMSHVQLDEQGRYIIVFNNQECYVEVEDTFFVIKRVERNESGRLTARLNDGEAEELDPSTLSQNKDNVVYAKVKNGRFPARFLRPAYYQLAEMVEEKGGRFVVNVGGRDYPIA